MATKKKRTKKGISELRQDLVSGDWVVIATGRARKPHAFVGKPAAFGQPVSNCPFENPFSVKEPPLLRYDYEKQDKKEGWAVAVVPNQFPAFTRGECGEFYENGPYKWTEGVGLHELFITRGHKKYIQDLSLFEITTLVKAYKERYHAIVKEGCVKYISIFHNHGKEAGASIAHPHSQLIALPVLPPDVYKSLKGSEKYFEKNGRCVHCDIVAHEVKAKKRIIYENKKFIAFAPFVSRIAFEVRIFPKSHQSSFDMMEDKDFQYFAEALQTIIAKLHKGLNDPAFNFFIHTAPIKNSYHQYHWHVEVIPKTAVWAGFEMGTGIEISTIMPEDAAKFLKKIKIK